MSEQDASSRETRRQRRTVAARRVGRVIALAACLLALAPTASLAAAWTSGTGPDPSLASGSGSVVGDGWPQP